MDNNNLSDESIKKALETTICELDLMVSTYNCLNSAKIKTVADIVNYGEKGLLRVRNLGKRP